MSNAGYFPRGDSVLRMVHGERAVGLLYGQRALMIGALNPLTFIGTIENTAGRLRPFRRLAHTGKIFEQVMFGTRAEADEALVFVHHLHERVSGTLPEDAGAHRAGTPYSAFDPELMLWTLAVIADSGPYFYELFARRLSSEEHERLWQDYVRFGELFGMPRGVAPRSHREFRDWWEAKLASEEMHLTEEARRVGYATAFEIPLPASHQPAKRVHDLIMLGSLPPRVRELYGLSWSAAHAATFAALVRSARLSRPLAPRALRRGSSAEAYDLVARTERQRIERGRPTPQVAG